MSRKGAGKQPFDIDARIKASVDVVAGKPEGPTAPRNIAAIVRQASRGGNGVVKTLASEAAIALEVFRRSGLTTSLGDQTRRNSYGAFPGDIGHGKRLVPGQQRNSSYGVGATFAGKTAGNKTVRLASQSPYASDQTPPDRGVKPATAQKHNNHHHNSTEVRNTLAEDGRQSGIAPTPVRSKSAAAIVVKDVSFAPQQSRPSSAATNYPTTRASIAMTSGDHSIVEHGDDTLRHHEKVERHVATAKVLDLVNTNKFSPKKGEAPMSNRATDGSSTRRSLGNISTFGAEQDYQTMLQDDGNSRLLNGGVSLATYRAGYGAFEGNGANPAAAAAREDREMLARVERKEKMPDPSADRLKTSQAESLRGKRDSKTQ